LSQCNRWKSRRAEAASRKQEYLQRCPGSERSCVRSRYRRNGHINEARGGATYQASERLSFNFAEQWNRFRLGIVTDPAGNVLPAGAGSFSVVFGSFQTNYSFSRFLTLSTLLQMDTANNQAATANIRLRWNYRPDSDLYVIYTAGQRFASLVATNPPQFYE
jgi:hypothetical protein